MVGKDNVCCCISDFSVIASHSNSSTSQKESGEDSLQTHPAAVKSSNKLESGDEIPRKIARNFCNVREISTAFEILCDVSFEIFGNIFSFCNIYVSRV